jgi:hypothetical protein
LEALGLKVTFGKHIQTPDPPTLTPLA